MSRACMASLAAAVSLCAVAAARLPGQSLASRIDAVREGTVEFTFASRPEVCGDGRGSTWTTDNGYRGYNCIHGPVRVTIGRADNQTVSLRSCVACSPRSNGGDLGDVPAQEAVGYLLDLARTVGGSSADHAVSAAAFADVPNVAPDLTRLVRDDNATMSARKQALFWLGQTGDATRDLVALDPELTATTLREQYVFVLSQRRDDPALDKLIDIARHDPSVDTRKKAMFWLGQSHEPKAIAFFREVLKP